jgi:hypothetical protein
MEDTMPRYLIERDISGWTDEDLDAAGLRAKMCAPWFEHLNWIISYRDRARELLYCIYDAENEEQVRSHSKFSGIPLEAVRPVEEIDPNEIVGGDVEGVSAPDAALEQTRA